MNSTRCFFVESPQASFTWLGQAEPDGAHYWLCTPGGKRVLRVPKEFVRDSNAEETAAAIVRERRARIAGSN
jgi:hypothetical protein